MAADDGERDDESLWLRAAASTPTDASPRPSEMPAHGDVIGEKYRIDHMIGQGGMGAVFKATHVVMESPVAVKWLMPSLSGRAEARERFVREARAAARIRHPNVVQVFDVGEQDGALYMVMELLDGEPFDAVIERGHMPIPEALQLLVQAMWGVGAAHERGIVHRDIKPENIFVVKDPTQPTGLNAKVLDFGISKLSDEDQAATGLTKSGVTMGTPAYMSMEQINGARDVDARTDVYAFGVLMYRALTGRLPFDGETFGAVAVAAATQTPPTPKELRHDLPVALSNVVVRAMARDREDRYASVQELLEALKSLSTAEGYLGQMTQPSTVPPSLTPKSANRLKQRGGDSGAPPGPPQSQHAATGVDRKLAGLAVAIILLGVGVAVALLWPQAGPSVEARADPGEQGDDGRGQAEREAAARADEKTRQEPEAQAEAPKKSEAEARRKAEAEARELSAAQKKAEAKAREQVEAQKKAEAAIREKAEAKKRAEAERLAADRRAELERKRKAEEAERKRKAEQDRLEREARQKAEAERLAEQHRRQAEAAKRRRHIEHRSGGIGEEEL